MYETTEYTQDVTLAVGAEYQTVGFSATTETEELISGELKLLFNEHFDVDRFFFHIKGIFIGGV